MKPYIFRDVWTSKIYRTFDKSSAEAKYKIARAKNIKHGNLALVKPQEKVSHA